VNILKHTWEDNIKIELGKVCDGMDWIQLVYHAVQLRLPFDEAIKSLVP
jgi:hypothetical protein